MLQTLLHKSGNDVKHYTVAKGSFDGTYFDKYILSTELNYFNSLSNDFRKLLIADLKAEYINGIDYVKGKYVEGDQRIFDGFLYEACQDTCEVPPCEWKKIGRFNTTCYQRLWDCFLGKILAGYTLKMAASGIQIQATPKGFISQTGDNFNSVDLATLSQWLKAFEETIQADKTAMLIYINQHEGTCFDELKECLPCLSECEPCGKIGIPNNNAGFISAVGGYNKYG